MPGCGHAVAHRPVRPENPSHPVHPWAARDAHARALAANNSAGARELAAWKARIALLWPALTLRLVQGPPSSVSAGSSFTLTVAAALGELAATDVYVECQLGAVDAQGQFTVESALRLLPEETIASETLYSARVAPGLSGLAALRFRAWPTHPLLAHRFEVGRMRWL